MMRRPSSVPALNAQPPFGHDLVISSQRLGVDYINTFHYITHWTVTDSIMFQNQKCLSVELGLLLQY